jgi:hypothetical protein
VAPAIVRGNVPHAFSQWVLTNVWLYLWTEYRRFNISQLYLPSTPVQAKQKWRVMR